MFPAIYGSGGIANLATHVDSIDSILPRLLDGVQVEQKVEAVLLGTSSVHRSLAVSAVDACTLWLPALFASRCPLTARNSGEPFCKLQQFRIAELDLGMEYSADDMDPVVSGRSLERLSRGLRSSSPLLFQEVEFSSAFNHLLFQPLLLTFTIGLLLMRYARWFHKQRHISVRVGVNGTQCALIRSRDRRAQVIEAHVTGPFVA